MVTVALPLYAAEHFVNTSSELEDAVGSIQSGDIITVADGIYNTDGSLTLKNVGSEEKPVLIRAENIGKARLTGETYFDLRRCSYVTIEGFEFTGSDITAVKMQASNNCRVTRNIFRLQESESLKWIVVGGIWDDPNAMSHHNRIDHNLFEEKHKPGNFITIDGTPDPTYKSSQFDRIDHNHFRNIGPRVENEMEAVRVGWSELSMSSGYTVVEYNLFENCDGDPEVISVKTGRDTVRYNTFIECQGSLCLRHGNGSVVNGNFFFGNTKEGSGGIRIYGDDHKIFNNYFEGLTGSRWDAALSLTNGDYDGGGNLSKHFRINRAGIYNNTFVNNSHNIEIGFSNSGKYDKPPRDVTLCSNLIYGSENTLVQIFSPGINFTWTGNIAFATGAATLGFEADSAEIWFVDPQIYRAAGFWRIAQSSPAADYGTDTQSWLTEDIEGQYRDDMPDAGCDEWSITEPKRRPLTAEDVGPFAADIVSNINVGVKAMPEQFLFKAYPLPFNNQLTIEFNVPRNYDGHVRFYDSIGRLVSMQSTPVYAEGVTASVRWTPDSELASGIYVCRIAGNTQKIMLLK